MSFSTHWKIAIETMRQLIWRKNSESLYLPLFYLWPWYGLLLLQVHPEVDWLLFRWLCQLVMKFVLVLSDNNSYIVCECIITVTVWVCYLYVLWQIVFNPDWIQMYIILTYLELGIQNSHLTTKPIYRHSQLRVAYPQEDKQAAPHRHAAKMK